MVATQETKARRTPDSPGVILSPVGGYGGDVYWVRHDGQIEPAPYTYLEFELEQPLPKPMQITTTYEIKPNHMNPKDGALIIHVLVNGEEVGTVQPLSGPLVDINEFVAGEVTMEELGERWSRKSGGRRKSKIADAVFDESELEVEITREFSDMAVGSKGSLTAGGRGTYDFHHPTGGHFQIPSNVAKNLDGYFKRA